MKPSFWRIDCGSPEGRWGATAAKGEESRFYCSVCGREIDEDEHEDYDGMCWECWDDQLIEESDGMFGDLM